jgi:D-3-phosphoglycerate dehydrogenase
MTEKPRLRVAVPSPAFCEHSVLREELLRLYPDAKLNMELRLLSGVALVDFLRGYDVAVVALEKMTEAVISELPDLKVISKLGTGVDMIDASAMARRGIRLGWKAGANALSIAELVIGFAIVGLRRMGNLNQQMKDGAQIRNRMGRLLSQRVFGLHGCGHIGQFVVRLLAPFDCTVLAHDLADRSAFFTQHGVHAVSFDQLLERSEILSIHIPLTPQTESLYDASVLGRLRKDCILINTARGELIDEEALYRALTTGRLFSACADVFRADPSFNPKLVALPNFFGTPHIGGSATEARLAMGRIAIDGILNNFVPVPGVHPFD